MFMFLFSFLNWRHPLVSFGLIGLAASLVCKRQIDGTKSKKYKACQNLCSAFELVHLEPVSRYSLYQKMFCAEFICTRDSENNQTMRQQ